MLSELCACHKTFCKEALEDCDVVFDFSSAKHVLDHIAAAAAAKKPMVVGTTGWQSDESKAKQLVLEHDAALIASPNFALGVALFMQLVDGAATLFSHFRSFDVGLSETHHRQKADSPSGTAKEMAHKVLQHYRDKTLTTAPSATTPLAASQIHLSSLRGGYHPGLHEVCFDSPEETITITHTSRNRDGFARGALAAAYWIMNKKGWYTLDDMIADKVHLNQGKPHV
jgi:4-hydroxy-tetrahydrodipicolinate reductase